METKQVTSDKNKRLIDAMKTVTRLSKRVSVLILLGAKPVEVYEEVLKVIASAPTEDAVEVVHGHWLLKQRVLFGCSYDYACSVCGYDKAIAKHNYCPDCGARMDEKEYNGDK